LARWGRCSRHATLGGKEKVHGGHAPSRTRRCDGSPRQSPLVTLLAVAFIPRLPQHTHLGLGSYGLFPRQRLHAAEGRGLADRLREYLDGLGSLLVGRPVRHLGATPGTVEGLEAAAHQVHVERAVNAAAVGHNGDGRVHAAQVLPGGREA